MREKESNISMRIEELEDKSGVRLPAAACCTCRFSWRRCDAKDSSSR